VFDSWHLRVLRDQGYDPPRSLRSWMVHGSNTNKKEKKVFKKFFLFFVFLFMFDSWHLRVFEESGVHDPWGPWDPEWFMDQTRIKKKKKFLKNFFCFLFFYSCLIHDTWGCSRNQGFMTPEVLEILNGSWIKHE
jgi:hypothetical protein